MKKLLLFLLLLAALDINAQNLPNIQRVSLEAPGNIKVDGKSEEWNDHFQAYNHATEVLYTLSNDSKNLYLTIKCTKPDIITKLLLGGVTFTIYASESKKYKNGISITYPMFDNKNQPFYLNIGNFSKTPQDLEKNKIQMDSIRKMSNNKLSDKLKFIGVEGIKSIEDTIISIYNTAGIKAASLFDEKLDFVYELSIPIKYINFVNTKLGLIKYNVQLNGSPRGGGGVKFVSTSRGDRMIYTAENGVNYDLGQNAYNNFPTNFNGDYTLAR